MCELLKIGKSFLRDMMDNTCANIFFKTHCGQNGEYALVECRDGNGAGQGQRMGSSSPPRMVLSYPIPATPRPASHDEKNFLTPSPPLRAP